MVTIKGIEFSEETIVGALEKAGISLEKPKPYQFQAGDVAKSAAGYKRIIVRWNDSLVSFGEDGTKRSEKQSEFEGAGYKKIGELKDCIK